MSYMLADDFDLQSNEYVGNKLEDFEILQTLGKGSYGFVAKVKSKVNHKLYEMKMIDFSLITDPVEINLSLNEIKIIQSLNSPHTIKYYTSFNKQNKLYIIMEFMNNGDVKGYIDAHKNMGNPIPEDELWELFYQCLAGVYYIHRNNLIHRDIKPANLFMTENKSIKIGDFGISTRKNKKPNGQFGNKNKETLVVGTPIYMSPEIFNHEGYGNKVDVYSLGVTFYEMCFFTPPREFVRTYQGMDMKNIPPKYNANYYSQEMYNLIQWMMEKNQANRPTSSDALNYVKKIYNNKNKNNSTIDCVYRCLFSFQNFTNYMKNNKNILKMYLKQKPISNSFMFAIKYFDSINWPSKLDILRDILTFENSCFPEPGLIDPIDLISFILKRIHKETILNNNMNSNNPYIIFPDNNPSALYYQQSLQNYLMAFQNYKSCIADFFFGTFHIIKLCSICKKNKFYFRNFFYLTFNIDESLKNGINWNNNNLVNYFIKQNSLIKNNTAFCAFCNNNTPHQESKKFFILPYNLIICFKGEKQNYENQYISYQLQLNLTCLGLNNSPCNYNLKGIIKCFVQDEKKFYTCIYEDFYKKQWVICDGYTKDSIISPMNHTMGDIVMLFYSSLN